MKKTVYLWMGSCVLEHAVFEGAEPGVNPAIVSRGLAAGK